MSIAKTPKTHVIIAGVPKAATSSVFSYLSAHPEVCGSSVKETAFFEKHASGDLDEDRSTYLRFFRHGQQQAHILVEASSGYVTCDDQVLKAIRDTLPGVRLLFILRDPVERLYSYYHFQVAQLRIPASVTFESFISLCRKHSDQGGNPVQVKFNPIHLESLRAGRYGEHLNRFIRLFGKHRVKIQFYEDLAADPKGFMSQLSEWLCIDPVFYEAYPFRRVNVTFYSRIETLHNLAMWADRTLEHCLRQRPRIKRILVSCYKSLNQAKAGYPPMSPPVRRRLESYYAESADALRSLVPDEPWPSWLKT
jgi:hypothetical protein